MINNITWHVKLWRLVHKYWCFQGPCHLHFQHFFHSGNGSNKSSEASVLICQTERLFFYLLRRYGPSWPLAFSFLKFIHHTQRHTTLGRNPLEERSARHRDLYITKHSQQTNIHASGGIQTHNPSRRTAADPRLRPRGNWNGRMTSFTIR
jgi:hypothetical protein